jgi:peptide/nickel transport system permease protein
VVAVSWSLEEERRTVRRERVRTLRRSRSFLAGGLIVGVWILCALFGELIAPQDPLATDPLDDLAAPSGEHWFGTDSLGRDTFARVMAGGREMLIVAPLATLVATALGTAVGLAGGYFRGAVDAVLGRLMEAFLALPVVIFSALILVGVGSSRLTIAFAVGVPLAAFVARSVRAAVLSEREEEYIDAARVRGEGAAHIMFREILPNVAPVIVVEFTVRFAFATFAIANLGFIGVGVARPAPDWGRQVLEHYFLLGSGFLGGWVVLFPVLAIVSLVVGVSLIADAVTTAFDR